MVKNIKVLNSAHQAMSIRAAKMGLQKYELSTALFLIAIDFSDEEITSKINEIRNNLRTEYPDLDTENDSDG